GFNPILSGRENIYNNGAILGFSRREIDAKLEDIIAFAELEDFIDMPVQHYSSGMKVRLGFAVAAQMEPDVLIIDEVLAVGDLGFVLKCFKTIDTILPNTAIIFVSHSMPMISRICSQIILMEHGKTQFQGHDVGKAIDLYYARFAQNETNIVFDDGSIELEKIKLLDVEVLNNIPQLYWGKDLKIEFQFKNLTLKEVPVFNVTIFDKEQRPVAMLKPNVFEGELKIIDDKVHFIVEHKKILLSKGVYTVNIAINSFVTNEPLLRINSMLNFQIIDDKEIWPPFLLDSKFINV